MCQLVSLWIVINLRYCVYQHGTHVMFFDLFDFYRNVMRELFFFTLRRPHLLYSCLLEMCWQPVRHLLPCRYSMWCVSLLLCSLMSLWLVSRWVHADRIFWASALPEPDLGWGCLEVKGISSAAQWERFSTLEMLITEHVHVAQRIFATWLVI